MSGSSTVAGALLVLLAAAPAAAHAQLGEPWETGAAAGADALFADRILEREVETGRPLIDHDGRYIVVHLAENRVFVFDGRTTIWSAPAGTGTGFELTTEEHEWTFSTPRGLMRVRRMEKNPIWIAPDWHWLERGLTPPPQDSPERFIEGGMGTTAIYLGDGIAIHGTDKPELLMDPDPEARQVSHGCIRLTNEHARELLHLVEVGTPVLIF